MDSGVWPYSFASPSIHWMENCATTYYHADNKDADALFPWAGVLSYYVRNVTCRSCLILIWDIHCAFVRRLFEALAVNIASQLEGP